MGVRNIMKHIKKQHEYQEDAKKLEEKNKYLLQAIECLLTKGTCEFLKQTRAMVEKNKQEIVKAKDMVATLNRQSVEKNSIKRLRTVGCSTAIISNTRANQYQEPINKLAYKVVDKVKFLRRKGFANER
jgi:hypothetical protein